MKPAVQCLECHHGMKGRSDKKFCNEKCKAKYHNRLNKPDNRFIRRINYALRKNRQILADLLVEGKKTIPRSWLLQRGFDFEIITAIHHKKSGNICYFCYEYGYCAIDDSRFRLLHTG